MSLSRAFLFTKGTDKELVLGRPLFRPRRIFWHPQPLRRWTFRCTHGDFWSSLRDRSHTRVQSRGQWHHRTKGRLSSCRWSAVCIITTYGRLPEAVLTQWPAVGGRR